MRGHHRRRLERERFQHDFGISLRATASQSPDLPLAPVAPLRLVAVEGQSEFVPSVFLRRFQSPLISRRIIRMAVDSNPIEVTHGEASQRSPTHPVTSAFGGTKLFPLASVKADETISRRRLAMAERHQEIVPVTLSLTDPVGQSLLLSIGEKLPHLSLMLIQSGECVLHSRQLALRRYLVTQPDFPEARLTLTLGHLRSRRKRQEGGGFLIVVPIGFVFHALSVRVRRIQSNAKKGGAFRLPQFAYSSSSSASSSSPQSEPSSSSSSSSSSAIGQTAMQMPSRM